MLPWSHKSWLPVPINQLCIYLGQCSVEHLSLSFSLPVGVCVCVGFGAGSTCDQTPAMHCIVKGNIYTGREIEENHVAFLNAENKCFSISVASWAQAVCRSSSGLRLASYLCFSQYRMNGKAPGKTHIQNVATLALCYICQAEALLSGENLNSFARARINKTIMLLWSRA